MEEMYPHKTRRVQMLTDFQIRISPMWSKSTFIFVL